MPKNYAKQNNISILLSMCYNVITYKIKRNERLLKMKLYIKQHIFTWGDKFTVYDEQGNDRFYVWGEVFSWGKKLHLTDLCNNELAYIRQKVWTFLPCYYIFRGDLQLVEVTKEFTFFRSEYSVSGLDWTVNGDFFAHDYTVDSRFGTVATVSKKWFTLGDAYEIDIADGIDPVNAIAVVLVIDACIEAQNNS